MTYIMMMEVSYVFNDCTSLRYEIRLRRLVLHNINIATVLLRDVVFV